MKNKKLVKDMKDFLFDLWETNHFVKINNTVCNADATILAYDAEKQCFEIYRLTDYNLENVILTVKKEDVIYVNDQEIISDVDLKNIINERWKTSKYIKINGFLFSTNECYNLFISNKLTIYNEGGYAEVTFINIEEINSLIIDEEKVL